jgi:DNA-binding response OmpR family regulator
LTAHIVIVDDEELLRNRLASCLLSEGFRVTAVDSAAAMREVVRRERIDLAVVDLGMPGENGLSLTRFLREQADIAIVILTGRGHPIDRAIGLEVGADDYVAKPFSRPELLARIEAVLRRHRREAETPERRERLAFGNVTIDIARREVMVDEQPVHLTTKEFDLLAHMAASPGRIFTRDQLLARIWGYDYVGDGRTVDVHVSWLRGKLRGSDGHNYFRTVRGVGYAFSPRAA